MKNSFIIWLICTILLTVCFTISGCRTGGKWIKSNSAGTVVSPIDLQKGSDGVYRPKKVPSKQTPKPPETTKKPIKLENKVKNTETPKKSAVLPPKPVETKTKPTPLKPVETSKLIEGDGGRVIITDNNSQPVNGKETPEKEVTTPVNIDENQKSISVDWLQLFFFYFLCTLGLVFIWVVIDLIRSVIKNKEHSTEKTKPIRKRRTKKSAKKTKS